jgi:hydrogenase maturation factor/phosphoheptose isomerase
MADAGAAEAGASFGAGLEDDLARAALALARRFAAGATLWCVAPSWPAHARHVAVEFVHPVIMGTRALPAVSVVDPDPVPALRSTVRSGDVLLAVSTADDRAVHSAVRRAGAWGVTTVWVGAGRRPEPGAADHVLWTDGPPDVAAHDGSIVRIYHLLWELTHVCFEHPGLLRADEGAQAACEVIPGCITCSDEGRLAEVLESGADTAEVRTAEGSETVDTMVVGQVQPGDLLLVHAGAAIAVLEQAGSGA